MRAFRMFIPFTGQGKRLVLYCLIGCTGAGLDFLIFALLSRLLGVHYLAANVFSVSLGITNNFFLNRRYNFKVKDAPVRRYVLFFLTGMLGLAISTVTMLQFVLNSLITFRSARNTREAFNEP